MKVLIGTTHTFAEATPGFAEGSQSDIMSFMVALRSVLMTDVPHAEFLITKGVLKFSTRTSNDERQ